MKARLSLGSVLPQMQRISPSSSSSEAGLEAVGAGLDLPFLFFLVGGAVVVVVVVVLAVVVAVVGGLLAPLLWVGAGEEEALGCWPLVARPERRGSSVNACQLVFPVSPGARCPRHTPTYTALCMSIRRTRAETVQRVGGLPDMVSPV